VARSLLDTATPMIEERGLTLLGFSVGNLGTTGGVQLALPFERADADVLDEAFDDVRDKFGAASLTRAATIGSNADFGVPILPD
jgi:DNA polymerase-4